MSPFSYYNDMSKDAAVKRQANASATPRQVSKSCFDRDSGKGASVVPESSMSQTSIEADRSAPIIGNNAVVEKKLLPPSSQLSTTTPHDNDVLCGRGGSINTHPGNETFRRFVERRKKVYLTARFKREKRLIANSIVNEIKALDPPGRFLARDTKSGLWCDIGEEKARDKTSQALRENAPSIRKEIEVENDVKRAEMRKAEEEDAIRATEAAKHGHYYSYYPSHDSRTRHLDDDYYDEYGEGYHRSIDVKSTIADSRAVFYSGHEQSMYRNCSHDNYHSHDEMDRSVLSETKSSASSYFPTFDWRKKPSSLLNEEPLRNNHRPSVPVSDSSNLRSSSCYHSKHRERRSVHFPPSQDLGDRRGRPLERSHPSTSRHDDHAAKPWSYYGRQDHLDDDRRRSMGSYPSGEYGEAGHHRAQYSTRSFSPVPTNEVSPLRQLSRDELMDDTYEPYHGDHVLSASPSSSSAGSSLYHRLPREGNLHHEARQASSFDRQPHAFPQTPPFSTKASYLDKRSSGSEKPSARHGPSPAPVLPSHALEEKAAPSMFPHFDVSCSTALLSQMDKNGSSALFSQFNQFLTWDTIVRPSDKKYPDHDMDIEPISSCSAGTVNGMREPTNEEEGQEVELLRMINSMDCYDDHHNQQQGDRKKQKLCPEKGVAAMDNEMRTPPPNETQLELDWTSTVGGCHSFFKESLSVASIFGDQPCDHHAALPAVHSMEDSLGGTEAYSCAGSIGGASLCNVFDGDIAMGAEGAIPPLAYNSGGQSNRATAYHHHAGGSGSKYAQPSDRSILSGSDKSSNNLSDHQLSLTYSRSRDSLSIPDDVMSNTVGGNSGTRSYLETKSVCLSKDKSETSFNSQKFLWSWDGRAGE